ncbi:MAG: response regulator [Candidatus Nanopelagicaceae bacterium]|jgi:DNA-binding NarL/FixJ family response regulator
MTPKILVIDDHVLVREGLRRALSNNAQFNIVGEAASKREALVQIPHHKPEVILVDLHLPDGSGLEIIAWARALSQQMGIVALTFSTQPEHILACMQSGASAHVSKSAPIKELVDAIEKSVLSPLSFSTRRATDLISKRNESIGLTARELEVLEILPTGDTVTQIATRLFVSEATVKSHLAAIYRKLKVANRVKAINAARLAGLLPK